QIGRSLELWAPQVLQSAGNKKLTGAAVVTVSSGVKALEIPQALTRKHGDIHPEGNPHVWLSPSAALKIAENIKASLVTKDPMHKADYEKNFLTFKTKLADALFGAALVKAAGSPDFLFRLQAGKTLKNYVAKRKQTLGGWLKLAEAIDYPFITYHEVWSYMADEFALKVFANIEEKSGVAPSLKYQNELIKKAKAQAVTHIVAASYYVGHRKLIDLIAEKISGKKLFVDVDCRPGASYFDMMNRILKSLVEFKMVKAPIKQAIPPVAPKRKG
ncbi:MAG TPA: metal ABC transporter substrate-binding protein, partial [Myxococcota bacterium]|nr:metal ABC transporter substrate-binding protein [Myxococcota bacterium]